MAVRPHVVIVGGGFGGLNAAQTLGKAPVRVTLVDRRNFHLFQPLLYQVAMGALSPANIASPLRALLKRQRNTEVLLDEVTGIDVPARRVLLKSGEIAYDTLIVAAGATHHYFGHHAWEELAPGLKTIEDALTIRVHVLSAFEFAEREADAEKRQSWLTFVVVGGGPTGVELAGAIGELSRHTLRNEFRQIDPTTARILLLEGLDRVLPPYPSKLSAKAAQALTRLGVTVRPNTIVTNIEPGIVTIRSGDRTEHIAARTVLWAAGVQASPLGRILGQATGASVDRAGRVDVQPDLTLPGHPEIFVVGDLAQLRDQSGKPLPGVAPVAIQQGHYAAELIRERLRGGTLPPFRYRDHGNMATIGRAAAVADLHGVRLSGLLAWLAWLFIHLLYLVEFQNRMLVLLQWGWNYFTRNRSARLITGIAPATAEPNSTAPVGRKGPV
jgi:NADH dehydrogenase